MSVAASTQHRPHPNSTHVSRSVPPLHPTPTTTCDMPTISSTYSRDRVIHSIHKMRASTSSAAGRAVSRSKLTPTVGVAGFRLKQPASDGQAVRLTPPITPADALTVFTLQRQTCIQCELQTGNKQDNTERHAYTRSPQHAHRILD